MTSPPNLTRNRRKFSAGIRDAGGWLELARKDAKRGDYKKAQEAVLCACFALDNAMQYQVAKAK